MALSPQQQQLLLLATARQRQAQAQQGGTQPPQQAQQPGPQPQAQQPGPQPQAQQPGPQPQAQQPAAPQAPQPPDPSQADAAARQIAGAQLQGELGPILGPIMSAAVQSPFGGDIVSGMNALGDTASFGLAPAAMKATQNAFNPGSGDQTAQDIAATNAAHPAGVVAGTLASIPVDMALTAPVAELAPAVPAVNAFLRGGGIVGNVARVATTGAVTGAVNAATHGGDPLVGGAVGAIIGPAGAAIAKPLGLIAEKLITPAATKAWRYLAGKLGEAPDDMIQHITQYIQQTGQQPSLQQIVSDHDAGVISKFGSDFPQAGEVLRSGAQASDQALPAQAQQVVQQAQQQLPAAPGLLSGVNPATASKQALLDTRDAGTTAAMNGIRQTGITLPDELRDDVVRQLGTGRAVRALRTRFMDGSATLDDLDRARRRLNTAAGGAVPNPDLQDIADELEQEGRTQVPQYGRVLDRHAEASRYADTFEHGASGQDAGAATDPGLRAALRTTEGQNGFNAGALARTASQAGGSPAQAAGVLGDISRPGTAQAGFQAAAGAPAAADAATAAQALRTAGERARQTAPGALRPQADTSAAAANVVSGVAESPVAPISAARNISRGVYQALSGLHLSTAEQRGVANALVSRDPAIRSATIERLRRAGVSDARLKLLSGLASAHTAKQGTDYQSAGDPSDGVVVRMGARG